MDFRSLLDAFNVKMEEIVQLSLKAYTKECKKLGLKIPCKGGCAHCCSLGFYATLAEGILAARAGMQRTESGILKIPHNASDMLRSNPSSWRRPCSFLGEDGYCTIYEARPAACRLHWVVSDPARCAEDQAQLIDVSLEMRAIHVLARLFYAEAGAPDPEVKLLLFPQAVELGVLVLTSNDLAKGMDLARIGMPEAWII